MATAVAGLLLGLPLSAQRTWIVDSANGPGTDFLDIDDAYSASGVGDTILVRPGNGLPYDLPSEITRSIRIVAPGAFPVPVRQHCTAHSIPARNIVVFDNMNFATENYNANIQVRSARGLVILSRMYAYPQVYAATGYAEDCERIVFTRVHNYLNSGAGIWTRNSNVWLIDSYVRANYSRGFQPQLTYGAAHFSGGNSSRRFAWVIGCRIEGGNAHPNLQSGPDRGIYASNLDLFVAGQTTVLGPVAGSAVVVCPQSPNTGRGPSLSFVSRQPPDPGAKWLAYDPNTTLDNCALVDGYKLQREFPAVLPGEAIRGQRQSIVAYGPSGSIVTVFASFVHGEEPVKLSVGDVWLDPYLVVEIGSAAVSAGRTATLHTTIPPWLALGDVLVYQAASLSSGTQWELSQPGFAVVRDP
ncbi:MAG: hypothetical protein IPM29_24265 [Planctomycetes bacterium]|nr:hypothetical protein [Planctomycetota bacterium]